MMRTILIIGCAINAVEDRKHLEALLEQIECDAVGAVFQMMPAPTCDEPVLEKDAQEREDRTSNDAKPKRDASRVAKVGKWDREWG